MLKYIHEQNELWKHIFFSTTNDANNITRIRNTEINIYPLKVYVPVVQEWSVSAGVCMFM